MRHTRVAVVAAALVLASLVGDAAASTNYNAGPYEHNKITIAVKEIYYKKDKIWFRLTVINGTGKELRIDRDQMTAKASTGIKMRKKAIFGISGGVYSIKAGESGPLNIEFEVPEDASIDLVLKQGIILEGKSIPLPNFTAKKG
jgi:hypothetical protein